MARVRSSNEWCGGSPESAVHSVESNPPIEQNGSTIRIGYNLPEDAKRHVSIAMKSLLPADTTVQAGFRVGRNLGGRRARYRSSCTPAQADIRAQDLGPQSAAWRLAAAAFMPSRSRPHVRPVPAVGSFEADLTGSGDVDVHTGSGRDSTFAASTVACGRALAADDIRGRRQCEGAVAVAHRIGWRAHGAGFQRRIRI